MVCLLSGFILFIFFSSFTLWFSVLFCFVLFAWLVGWVFFTSIKVKLFDMTNMAICDLLPPNLYRSPFWPFSSHRLCSTQAKVLSVSHFPKVLCSFSYLLALCVVIFDSILLHLIHFPTYFVGLSLEFPSSRSLPWLPVFLY